MAALHCVSIETCRVQANLGHVRAQTPVNIVGYLSCCQTVLFAAS
jgi:hypothetical protein